MKKVLFYLILICVLFVFIGGAESGQSHDVKKIIQKCAEAMGGMDKINALRTLRFAVEYPGHDYTVITDIERPNLMRNSGGRGIGLFDGKNGCILKKDKKTGKFTQVEMVTDDFLADFYVEPGFFTFYFFDFPAKYVGKTRVNNTDVYQLQVDLPLKAVIHYYINAKTYLPVRTIAHVTLKGKKVQWGRDYLDYKNVAGILYPHNFRYFWNKRKKERATVKKIEFNLTFAKDHFKIPEKE